MRRLLNVEQTLQLFELDVEVNAESEPESDDFDDEVDDPSFALEDEEEPPRSAQRKRRRDTPTKSSSLLARAAVEHLCFETWKMEEDADTAPAIKRFQAAEPRLTSEPWKMEDADTAPAVTRFQAAEPRLTSEPWKMEDADTVPAATRVQATEPWKTEEDADTVPAATRVQVTEPRLTSEPWKTEEDADTVPAATRVQATEPRLTSEPWKTEEDADTVPAVSRFQPRRTPGVQVETFSPHSPKDLFLLFFATDTVGTICINTNKNAAKNKELGKKYKWTDVEMEELYKFFGLLMYMSLVSLPSLQDYWRQSHMLSVPLPAKVMSRDRFKFILWNIHLSNPEEDVHNDRKKGTAGHDKLFRVRPLYDDILRACQAHCHLRRELAVDQLIQFYSTHRKTARWYTTVLLHFLDIATTNAFILHREMSSAKQAQPMTHKDFMVELVCQLCGVDQAGVAKSRRADHVPVPIATTIDARQKASKGRLKCKRCLQEDKRRRKNTPWKCQACDVPLCLVMDRNCFLEWHK